MKSLLKIFAVIAIIMMASFFVACKTDDGDDNGTVTKSITEVTEVTEVLS